MSLGDDIAAVTALRPGPRCSFTQLDLDEADSRDLEHALADGRVPASAISRVLISRGYGIKPQTVNRHRRRICDCP